MRPNRKTDKASIESAYFLYFRIKTTSKNVKEKASVLANIKAMLCIKNP
jgi:hypothetical protein